MLTAVRLMQAGAVIEVLAVVVALVSRASLKSSILARHPAYTAAQLRTAEVARTVPLIVGGVIAAGCHAVIWLVGLGVIVLIFSRPSGPFYRRPAA
ncbi:MAG TPA: hypothetical protein VGM79_26880 [Streptosporangiaceae bacterium]